MDTSSKKSPRVAIIGAGISGLSAAAHFALEVPSASIDVFDASDRVGGVIHTEYMDGMILEHAADNFATNLDHVANLHSRLGIEPELYRLTNYTVMHASYIAVVQSESQKASRYYSQRVFRRY